MTVDNLISSEHTNRWGAYKIPETEDANSKFFNLVEIRHKYQTAYGFIRESTNSLVIPLFAESSALYKNVMANWNRNLLTNRTDKFAAQEFCNALGFNDTESGKNIGFSLLVGKYCVGPVTSWSEVGILIKSEKHLECKPVELAELINSELKLIIEPVTAIQLESIK